MALLFLFAHLIGVAGLAGAVTLEIVAMDRIRRAARTGEIRAALAAAQPAGALFPAAALVLIVTGGGLVMLEGRDWRAPWLLAAFVLVVAAALVGHLINGRRLGALASAAFAGEGDAIAPDVDARRRDPVLRGGAVFSTTTSVALVFVMTVKPDALVSVALVLATVAAAIVAGAAAAPARTVAARAAR